MTDLKRTPLYSEYRKSGGKTIDFGGWDLPVQFSSIKQEHEVTRTKAGLFDVSHMGEIHITGPKSEEYLQGMTTNDVTKLVPGRAQYTLMCYQDGGTVDDFIIYMLAEKDYLLVVNAANTIKDFEWLEEHNTYTTEEVSIKNVSEDYAQLALQGPLAEEILQRLTETDLATIKFFRFAQNVKIGSIKSTALVSRTGYTGEDGFEIYISKDAAPALWNLLLEKGADKGLEPIGLGARDTLRFEANLALYGQELSSTISPVEAGLTFAVKVNKGDFVGREVLSKQIEEGPKRRLIGIEMIDKGIPRHGYKVLYAGEEVGFVTSGTQSPTLKKNIGLVLVNQEVAQLGQKLTIQVRKKELSSVVIQTPFYKREK